MSTMDTFKNALAKEAFWFLVLGVMVALALPAQAQVSSSGTVAISGAPLAAVKLSTAGDAALAGNITGGITSSGGADASLATIVDFGDVGPANTNAYVCLSETLYLRATAASTFKAAVTAESFLGGVQKTDIGIGLTSLTAPGGNADITGAIPTAGFGTDPCGVAKDADGIPLFTKTLNDLGTVVPTTLVSFPNPISLRGSFTSPNNRAELVMKMAIGPQAFATGAFSATVTFTLSSP